MCKSLFSRLQGVPPSVAVALLGAMLVLPGLGSYGLWEPAEVRVLEVDQTRVEQPLVGTLISVSVGLLGQSELSARLPFALSAIGCLLLLLWLGRRLASKQAGRIATLVLATSPLFLFQGRLATSDLVLWFASLAQLGGTLVWLLCSDRRLPYGAAVVAAVGWVASPLCLGALEGLVLPAVALAGGIFARGSRFQTKGGLHPWAVLAVLVVLGTASAGYLLRSGDWTYALILAPEGSLRWSDPLKPLFVKPIQMLGYGMFPWIALLPWALAQLCGKDVDSSTDSEGGALHPMGAVTVATAVVLFFAVTVAADALTVKRQFIGVPWLALLVGTALANWSANRRRDALGVAIAVVFLFVIQRDVVIDAGSLAFAHLEKAPSFPDGVPLGGPIRVGALLFTALIAIAMGRSELPSNPEIGAGDNFEGRAASRIKRVARRLYRVADWIWREATPRRAAALFLSLTVVMAAWLSWAVVPQLSTHLSSKLLFETYRTLPWQ